MGQSPTLAATGSTTSRLSRLHGLGLLRDVRGCQGTDATGDDQAIPHVLAVGRLHLRDGAGGRSCMDEGAPSGRVDAEAKAAHI